MIPYHLEKILIHMYTHPPTLCIVIPINFHFSKISHSSSESTSPIRHLLSIARLLLVATQKKLVQFNSIHIITFLWVTSAHSIIILHAAAALQTLILICSCSNNKDPPFPQCIRRDSNIRYWFLFTVFSEKSTRCFTIIFSGCGLQILTVLSIPLVARRQVVGCGTTQFTMAPSPR